MTETAVESKVDEVVEQPSAPATLVDALKVIAEGFGINYDIEALTLKQAEEEKLPNYNLYSLISYNDQPIDKEAFEQTAKEYQAVYDESLKEGRDPVVALNNAIYAGSLLTLGHQFVRSIHEFGLRLVHPLEIDDIINVERAESYLDILASRGVNVRTELRKVLVGGKTTEKKTYVIESADNFLEGISGVTIKFESTHPGESLLQVLNYLYHNHITRTDMSVRSLIRSVYGVLQFENYEAYLAWFEKTKVQIQEMMKQYEEQAHQAQDAGSAETAPAQDETAQAAVEDVVDVEAVEEKKS